MQTYKCSTHQSYPCSAFLASERRRERDLALSLCLQIPLPNSPLKGARCPTKKKKKSGGNTTSTTRDPSPRLLIQTRSITCTRSTTETKATPTSCPKRDARRTFAARRISVRICVAEICLPKCTHVLTVFLSTFALTRTLSLSLSLSLKSAAHPTTGTVHGGELLARNQREVLRARGRTLREDEDEVEEKKEGGGEGGFG